MTAPENPAIGQKWYDASVQPTGEFKIWTGTEWTNQTQWVRVGPGQELTTLPK